jgi:transcription elongation factor/antiterminator RfaH
MVHRLLGVTDQMREQTFSPEISQDRLWYVVYSKPRREEFAQTHLRRKGLEVFFPRLSLRNCKSGLEQCVPLFPNYLFVRLQLPEEYAYAIWSPGVKTIVSFNGVPAPIDEEIVTLLQQQADSGDILNGRPNLTVGQEVRIKDGPLEGLLGIIQDPPDARGRVGVLLQLLNRQVKVAVPVHLVTDRWVLQHNLENPSLVASAR